MGRKNISREKIIQSFLTSSFDKSAGATSLADVSDLLEIKKASLYNHFENREDMYKETVSYCGKEIYSISFITEKTFDSIKGNKILPSTLFKKLITRYFNLYENEPLLQIYAFLFSEQFYNDEVLEIVQNYRSRLEESIRKILQAFLDTKKYPSVNDKILKDGAICLTSVIIDKMQLYLVSRKSVVRKNPESGAGSLFSLPSDDFSLNTTIKNVEFILKGIFE